MVRYLGEYVEDVYRVFMCEDTRAAVRMIQAARPKSVAIYLGAAVAVKLQQDNERIAAEFLTMLEGATHE